MSLHYDIIVIGTGSMGAAACYYGAKQGLRVLGIDQFSPPHAHGSHSGQSRIIRQAYFEHPNYVPILQRAYTLWEQLEGVSEKPLFHKTGLVYMGPAEGSLIAGVMASAHKYDLKMERLERSEQSKRYPQSFMPAEHRVLFEPEAGFLRADEAIATLLNLSKAEGATMLSDHKVISWELRNDHAVVFTSKESFTAEKIIVTSGAYAKSLLPILRDKLTVTRQAQYWFDPKDRTAFGADKFTCWNIEDQDYPGLFYGFPFEAAADNPTYWGLKIAHHHAGELMHPDDAVNTNPAPSEEELLMLRSILSKYFPKGLGPLLRHSTCYYTNSPDGDFIIDHLPNTDGRVIFGAGFSGHGFKFAPAIGELLVDLAWKGKSDLEIDFVGLERFQNEEEK